MGRKFSQTELRLLSDTEEVEIEPLISEPQDRHRRTIWVVVVGSEAYARSVNGDLGHWYQALTTNPVGAIYAKDQCIPIRCVPVADALLQQQVSEAYQHKYAPYPQDVAWITGPEALKTTLRLEPESAGPSV
jgi:hypothetical protein